MSSNSNKFRQLNVNENCSSLTQTQITPENPADTSHPTNHAQK